jgi:hypothetical protein
VTRPEVSERANYGIVAAGCGLWIFASIVVIVLAVGIGAAIAVFTDKVTRVHQLLYRIETKAGVDEWSRTSIQWDPWYQNQPSIRARVL